MINFKVAKIGYWGTHGADTLQHQKDNLEDSDLQKILSGISEACSDLNNFRRNEGKSLHMS